MKKELKQELELLKQELGTPAFDERLDKLQGRYTSDEDKALIDDYVLQMLDNIGGELQEVDKELRDFLWSI